MTYTQMFECGDCQNTFDDADKADHCCWPHYDEVYVCNACKQRFYDEDELETCCEFTTVSLEDGTRVRMQRKLAEPVLMRVNQTSIADATGHSA